MAAFEVLALDTATPQIRAPGAADTYTFPRAITPSGANVTPFTISGYSLTGANAQSLIDLSGTWNTTGTPTALKLNVTDTASNASSLLMDLQVGGVSRINVSKNGDVRLPGGSLIVGGVGSAISYASSALTILPSGQSKVSVDTVAFNVSNLNISWTSNTTAQAIDLTLARDAANTLAQRNGVNAQTKRLYGTFTDASNYRRLAMAMTTGGVASIAPEGAGTGASGNVLHISGLPTANPGPGILWNDAGTVKVGT